MAGYSNKDLKAAANAIIDTAKGSDEYSVAVKNFMNEAFNFIAGWVGKENRGKVEQLIQDIKDGKINIYGDGADVQFASVRDQVWDAIGGKIPRDELTGKGFDNASDIKNYTDLAQAIFLYAGQSDLDITNLRNMYNNLMAEHNALATKWNDLLNLVGGDEDKIRTLATDLSKEKDLTAEQRKTIGRLKWGLLVVGLVALIGGGAGIGHGVAMVRARQQVKAQNETLNDLTNVFVQFGVMNEGENLNDADTRARVLEQLVSNSGLNNLTEEQFNEIIKPLEVFGITPDSLNPDGTLDLKGYGPNMKALVNDYIDSHIILQNSGNMIDLLLQTVDGTRLDQYKDVNEAANHIIEKVPELRSIVNELTTKYNTEKARADKLDGELLTANGRISELEAKLVTKEGELTAANTAVTTLTEQLETANDKVTELEGQLKTANGNVADLTEKLTTANARVTELEGQLATANARVTELEGQLATANGKVSDLEGQLATANAKVTELEGEITSKDQTIASLNERISQLESSGGNQEEIDRLNAQITTLTQEKETLEGQLKDEQANSSSLATQLASETERANGLQTQLDAETQRANGLQTQLDAATQRADGLEDQLDAATQRANGLQSQLDAEKSETARLTKELAQANEEKDELSKELEETQKLLDAYRQNASSSTGTPEQQTPDDSVASDKGEGTNPGQNPDEGKDEDFEYGGGK